MLTGVQIKQKSLIQGGEERCYRAASYDLRISKLVKPDGEVADSYVLPAQGIVEVISKERICIPHDITGLAMVKTSLCNEGLLALNIGIIDPGWNGPISSFLINFGKNDRLLSANEVFLRLTFHQLNEATDLVKPFKIEDNEYIEDRRRKVVAGFAKSFLNISQVIEKFTDDTFNKYKNRALGYVSAAAFILGALTFFLNFGNLMLVHRWLQPSDTVKADLLRISLEKQTLDLVEQNKLLNTRLEQLEKAAQTQVPANSSPTADNPGSTRPAPKKTEERATQ
ncbi:dCTP deaminase domain-containing protein [Melittangium boletus]|uniref:dCTP deaminase domain-containing protein n=1 Tax=Melittangium boletus TaxID=83453 RepID=UPI003DA3ABD9